LLFSKNLSANQISLI